MRKRKASLSLLKKTVVEQFSLRKTNNSDSRRKKNLEVYVTLK